MVIVESGPKELPMPFQAAMVVALLNGSKTMTRRPMQIQPSSGYVRPDWKVGDVIEGDGGKLIKPRYLPGDRIYGRESWRASVLQDTRAPRDIPPGSAIWYEATSVGDDYREACGVGKIRPPMFMPKWASRLWLEVTAVRPERLNAISSEDAIAEGLHRYAYRWQDCEYPLPDVAFEPWPGFPTRFSDPVQCFQALWESIHGPGSFGSDYVWVYTFKRIRP